MKKGNYPKEEKMNMNKNYWNNVFRARKEIYDILVNHTLFCFHSAELFFGFSDAKVFIFPATGKHNLYPVTFPPSCNAGFAS